MKFDLLGKTEQIRRKVKAILFDRKNRKLSDKKTGIRKLG